jgi:hypothetical protein
MKSSGSHYRKLHAKVKLATGRIRPWCVAPARSLTPRFISTKRFVQSLLQSCGSPRLLSKLMPAQAGQGCEREAQRVAP